jgi:hypothetical protein
LNIENAALVLWAGFHVASDHLVACNCLITSNSSLTLVGIAYISN